MNRKGMFRGKCVLALILVLFISSCSLGSFQGDIITWNDVILPENRGGGLNFRGYFNGSGLIVVDHNGRGDSLTVQGAIDMVPDDNTNRVKIYILPGVYREKVYVPKHKPYISFIGDEDQVTETVITWHNKASDTDERGNELGTYRSASITIDSDYFCATGITFENTVGTHPGAPGMQAVALRVSSSNAFFYRVRILGSQDTLLDEKGSHYYYRCFIQGTVDFIFGRARSLFRDCELHSIAKGSGAIAAHHRDKDDETGFSFVRCRVTGSGKSGKILLGRAWGDYSRIVYSFCHFNKIIAPTGWSDWSIPSRRKTAVFGEYHCTGKGAHTRGRVSWRKTFTDDEIKPFLGMEFIDGDQWLRL
ncbi:hypothetical protein K2173_012585 [Erythroxylum novogranatense]|uniref:Pectinesterase n=1 Tax=Erythroxylum novogranatense TaxID=1862640 RepID=A0AAV8S6C4_9ROSI|nr:hypothetical protein K2173_012585 [Erythroxylum novogranatense]